MTPLFTTEELDAWRQAVKAIVQRDAYRDAIRRAIVALEVGDVDQAKKALRNSHQ